MMAKPRGVSTSRHLAVRAATTRATANEWVQLRPARTAPTLAVISPLLFASGFPRERVAVVAAIHALNFLYGLSEAARSRRVGVEQRAIFVSHLILVTTQAIVVAITGGLGSPLWPGIVGTTLGTFYVFGRERESTIAWAYTTVLVLVIAILPAAVTGPPIARGYHIALAAWSILFTLFILQRSSVSLADANHRIGEALDRSREEVIAAAKARERSLDCIGSKVAHELKNPLSAVKGLVQLLARGAGDDRTKERLRVIDGEVTRMEAILRDYLSFSRPLDDLRPEPVEVGGIADDVLAVLEARADAAGVALTRTGGPVSVTGDPRRLKEALLNLIANALEATPRHGSVEVAVSGGDDGAVILVRDSGKGMGPEDLARVGTPFFTTREGGTGLGVVLARAAIRQHGGDLCFESEVGRGTTATVRLPAHAAEAAADG
jgi:signal transduction histidine kinase